ncbi:hypothetical protein [Nonomuraea dietziae]
MSRPTKAGSESSSQSKKLSPKTMTTGSSRKAKTPNRLGPMNR